MNEIVVPSAFATALTNALKAFEPDGDVVDALAAWFHYDFVVGSGTSDVEAHMSASRWSTTLQHAVIFPDKGTARAWFEARKGKLIDTYQVHSDGRTWEPQARRITEARPTFVEIDGSRRYYRELKVVTQTKFIIVIKTETAICAYRETA